MLCELELFAALPIPRIAVMSKPKLFLQNCSMQNELDELELFYESEKTCKMLQIVLNFFAAPVVENLSLHT